MTFNDWYFCTQNTGRKKLKVNLGNNTSKLIVFYQFNDSIFFKKKTLEFSTIMNLCSLLFISLH